MEFENVGKHCALEGCNQRDFLPFKCDVCLKSYCLDHRNYDAHNCKGAQAKNMTSIDCPICGKSIRMSELESPDTVWDTHFATSCSRKPETKLENKRCANATCNVTLGPSNTLTCPDCNRQVCLSHRYPESHNCGKRDGNRSQEKPKPKSSNGNNVTVKFGSGIDNRILSETAERRMKNNNPSSNSNNIYKCPICNISFRDPVDLMNHMSVHDDSVTSEPPIRSGNREVCPVCGLVFNSVTDLIAHSENSHSNSATSDSGSKCKIS